MGKYLNVVDEKQGINVNIPTKDIIDSSLDKSILIVLTIAGWGADNTQTIAVQGIVTDESKQLIIPIPSTSNQELYYGSGVVCSGFAENSLTFSCEDTPTADISVYIYIKNILE